VLDLPRVPLRKGLPSKQEKVQQCKFKIGKSDGGRRGERNAKDQRSLGKSVS